MADVLKLTVVLLIVSAAAGFAIALTNEQTAEKIKLQKILAEEHALQVVFPEGVTITKKKEGTDQSHWVAEKNGTLVGYALKGAGRGFSSDIKFIVGIDPAGTILGLTILSQTETPGLGTRVQEIVSKSYIWNGLFKKKKKDTPWFTRQFAGITVTNDIGIEKTSEWHTLSDEKKSALLKENKISAITGATISTYAVSSGVKKCTYDHLSGIKKQNTTITNDSLSQQDKL